MRFLSKPPKVKETTKRTPQTLDGLRSDEAGSITVLTALMLPIILGIVGLGTEVGNWYYTHQTMQGAADMAALSAANASSAQGSTGLLVEAQAATAAYGFIAGKQAVTVNLDQPPSSGRYSKSATAIQVTISQLQTRLFSKLFSSSQLTITARAVATASPGLGCILSLDQTASGATTVKGTASVTLNGCSLMDNSASSSALTVNGGGAISAMSVNVVGGISGSSGITTTSGSYTGVSPARDPYAASSFGAFSGCTARNFTSKKTETISPGVYCGGISLNSGASVTLNPGIYYLDQGSLTVNGGASLSGTGVTIVFTSSTGAGYATANINGGAAVNLTAPDNGSTAGIVFFGDRAMPVGTSFTFEGGASQTFGGALYLPQGAVKFAGGSGTGSACTQLVADTITFTGNSNFAIGCTGYGTSSIGSALAQLVE